MRRFINQIRLSAETGRSMVEMLGTLAIMGVLSVGGVAGYRYAVFKYQANETMDELNKRSVVYVTRLLEGNVVAGTVLPGGEFGDKTTLGYDVKAVAAQAGNKFEIELSHYPSEVCVQLLKNYTIPSEIIIGNTRYVPESDNYAMCGEGTAPDTVFVYASDFAVRSGGVDYPYEGTYGSCTPGVEFKSGSACYPCDTAAHYVLSTDEEYSLCAACGRSVAQGGSYITEKGYCVPACRTGESYHMGQQKCLSSPCLVNDDCGSGQYCKLDSAQHGNSCLTKPTYGTCEDVGNPTFTEVKIKDTDTVIGTYAASVGTMNWWSAQNYCSALGGRLATVDEFGCGYSFTENKTTGYCNKATNNKSSGQVKSEKMTAFQESELEQTYYWLNDWLSDSHGGCFSYAVIFGMGYIDYTGRNDEPNALCRVENQG